MVVVLVVTAVYARTQIVEARRLRREQTRPFVVPSVAIEQREMLVFVLENLGGRPAIDVHVRFDKGPFSTIGGIEELRLLREPTPTMVPGQRFRVHWEIGFNALADDYPHPKSYNVAVSYHDPDGTPYGPEMHLLDFRIFDGQATGLRGLSDIARTLEQIRQKL